MFPATLPSWLPLVIFLICAVNTVTYLVFCLSNQDSGRAILQHWSPARKDRKMVYLIAGTLNQPHTAFGFMLTGELMSHGVTMVKYRQTGFSAWQIARQITEDIVNNHYDATIYAISVGNQAARYTKYFYPSSEQKVRIISINPCDSGSFLRPGLRPFVAFGAIFLTVVCAILGWLSCVPIIPGSGNWFSLQLVADQLLAVAYGIRSYIPGYSAPDGIICSRRDEFLNNEAIINTFPDTAITYIDSRHGDTIGNATAYIAGLNALLPRIKPPL